MVNQKQASAETTHCGHVVRNHKNRFARISKLSNSLGTFFPKTAVAYSQVRLGTTSLPDIKRQIERDCIARALAETKGNITRAAALLGMKRPRLSQLVKQYGLAAVSSEGS